MAKHAYSKGLARHNKQITKGLVRERKARNKDYAKIFKGR